MISVTTTDFFIATENLDKAEKAIQNLLQYDQSKSELLQQMFALHSNSPDPIWVSCTYTEIWSVDRCIMVVGAMRTPP